jgi:hypothetical protein
MQEVLENAQKQAKEDKSKNMQKKRQNQDEIKEEIPEKVVGSNDEHITCSELPTREQNVSELPVEQLKEISKSPEVDSILQTSLSPTNRQKLITPSKFRSQTTSVAIQTELLK